MLLENHFPIFHFPNFNYAARLYRVKNLVTCPRMHIYDIGTCLGRVSHNGVVASVTGHGRGAVNAQSVAHIRRSLGLGKLGAGSRRGAQVSATTNAVADCRGRGNRHRRLRRGCDHGEIGDRSAIATDSLLLLLLLLLLRIF